MLDGPIEVELSGGSPLRCPYCHDDLNAKAEQRVCGGYNAAYHSECWAELGADCATCGWSSPAAWNEPRSAPRVIAVTTAKGDEASVEPTALSLVLLAQGIGSSLATLAAAVQAYGAVWIGGLSLGVPIPFLLGLSVQGERRGLSFLALILNVVVGVSGAVIVDELNVRKKQPSLVLFLLCLFHALLSYWLSRRASRRHSD